MTNASTFYSQIDTSHPAASLHCSPHITVAQYRQEEITPGNQLLVQCQTSGAITAEQGMVESLHIMKDAFNAIGVSSFNRVYPNYLGNNSI